MKNLVLGASEQGSDPLRQGDQPRTWRIRSLQLAHFISYFFTPLCKAAPSLVPIYQHRPCCKKVEKVLSYVCVCVYEASELVCEIGAWYVKDWPPPYHKKKKKKKKKKKPLL